MNFKLFCMLIMENYSGAEKEVDFTIPWDRIDYNICCDNDYLYERPLISTVHTIIDWSMLVILVAGLILISFLIYRKYKGSVGLWEKILKWNLLFFFIIIVIMLIVEFVFWYLNSIPVVATSSI